MQTKPQLSFFTLLLMISFASVNAVLFTPALPNIANFFAISNNSAQQTVTLFLIGYALGQLFYGPLANRYGRKPALYIGISLQIISSLLCAISGMIHEYSLLIIGRFLLALGSGVGLKMAFTLVNECYAPKIASQKLAYLTLAFAITPGLGVALGGFLNTHLGWMSCFYASAVYGILLLILVIRLPETQKTLDLDAFKRDHLIDGYGMQFKNKQLIVGGLIMGGSTCFIYIFAAVAPFIAMNIYGMNSAQYGIANLIPPIGLIAGSLLSAQLAKEYQLKSIICLGILSGTVGTILMLLGMSFHLPVLFALFLPTAFIYFGIAMIIANASTLAMSETSDKAHGSAVMNFLNMGLATSAVLTLGLFSITTALLPITYMIICLGMFGTYRFLKQGSLS